MLLDLLKRYNVILASNSPRRRELLADLGINFEVRTIKGIDESYPDDMPVLEIAEYISHKKALAYQADMGNDELIITADTVVILGDEVLGKPTDSDDACRIDAFNDDRSHWGEVADFPAGWKLDLPHLGFGLYY